MYRLIFDTTIISLIFGFVFKLVELIIKDHLKFFSILFNIQVREQNINRETDNRDLSKMLIFFTTSIVFLLVFIYSFFQFFFLLFLQAIDVVIINRLLLLLNIFKLMHHTNKFNWKYISIIVYCCINYTNKSTLFAMFFHLFDQCFNLNYYLMKLQKTLNKFVFGEINFLVETIAFLQIYKKKIKQLQFIVFLLTVVYLLIFKNQKINLNELYFLYFVTYRLICVYQYISRINNNL